MTEFSGKTALVANAGSAIGQAIVRRLLADGAMVMAAGGDGTHSCRLDVTSQSSWETALADTVKAFGRLDVLVTVATAKYAVPKTIAETDLAEFQSVNAQNLEGAFLGLRFGIVKMRELGHGGAVINVASALATIGVPGQAAYGASANGIRMMTRAAALSCADAKDRIRVNAVQVGSIDGAPESEILPAMAKNLSHVSHGTPADVAAAVAFLASDRASYITGMILPVDGGLLAA
jgi:3(or 17)beta-hydroxysteroid dehydrogenase